LLKRSILIILAALIEMDPNRSEASMKPQFVLAIDQGTTGTTALILDQELHVLGKSNVEFAQVFPQPGWVEHRAVDIWASVELAVTKCLNQSRVRASEITAIGITNQRETTCLFTPDGEPLHNFIVWQCRRTTEICKTLKDAGHEEKFKHKTGLVLDPYFSGTKLMWLFQNVPEALSMAQRGKALFGTIDSWLLHRLTGHSVHATDATNASRTLMMNLETCEWDDELLSILGVPRSCLPTIGSSSQVFGHTKGLSFLPDGIPVAGIAGDQHAALFGQACFNKGEAKATYGTGCFILFNTGNELVRSKSGLLTSIAIKLGNEVQYCLEGSAFIAGAAVQWLRDGLGIIKKSSEVEELAKQVESSGDVVFVPALSGLGAPFWRPEARGLFCGLSRDTNKAHLARAVLEGIALQNRDMMQAMQNDGGAMTMLKVDGGASANNLLMQFQADMLGIPCARPHVLETTALGAAALAGLGVGVFSNKEAFRERSKPERVFSPQMADDERAKYLKKWHRAIERA
jgi:glycerol kinase